MVDAAVASQVGGKSKEGTTTDVRMLVSFKLNYQPLNTYSDKTLKINKI